MIYFYSYSVGYIISYLYYPCFVKVRATTGVCVVYANFSKFSLKLIIGILLLNFRYKLNTSMDRAPCPLSNGTLVGSIRRTQEIS